MSLWEGGNVAWIVIWVGRCVCSGYGGVIREVDELEPNGIHPSCFPVQLCRIWGHISAPATFLGLLAWWEEGLASASLLITDICITTNLCLTINHWPTVLLILINSLKGRGHNSWLSPCAASLHYTTDSCHKPWCDELKRTMYASGKSIVTPQHTHTNTPPRSCLAQETRHSLMLK